ncbi:MAG: sigma-54-dependent Fis family transcriptional regulator [Desulfovibrionaceae bacterium]|nr:sigma-54-dependent Fis family transcriptional regulator [Desulfovibrionaceae bacterium]
MTAVKDAPAPSLLVVDDDPGHLAMLTTLIRGWGYATEGAHSGEAAVETALRRPFDLILMDVRMAGISGIEALRAVKASNPAIPILIMTAYSTVESAVEALKAGAYDYLTKPLDFDVLRLSLARALEHAGLRKENEALRRELGQAEGVGLIGASRAMRRVLDMVAMIAPSEATVLISGETGSGKELVARAIHKASARASGPLVAVNCAALAESLLESELFGHEKGAFTGAERRREGRFKQADGGTVFLDEIGEVSAAMQLRLLRVLQEREVVRVGGNETLPVDVRVLAATNRDLRALVADGRFRQDLYYRLNVVALHLPPLRERAGDIPLLAAHFLQKYGAKNKKNVQGFTPAAMDCLLRHPWPGNVRELENAVERAVVLSTGAIAGERELPPELLAGVAVTAPAAQNPVGAAAALPVMLLEDAEKIAVLAAMREAEGNKSQAARMLGVTRKTLHAKLRKYGFTRRPE